jgi:hypothetical protein
MLGFVGGIDDIRIYDRALTVDELKTLFPEQPKGRFEFNQATQETEESPTLGDFFTLSVGVDRIEGDDDTVSVGYVLKSGSALLNTDFKLPGTDADAIAGRGFLDWGVHDRAPKTLTVQILADELREGTESFTIELEAQPGEPGITEKKTINIDVLDKTPNVYGAIAFASSGGGINEAVNEGDAGVITVRRFGDDTQGAVDVWYTVQEFTAFSPEHFSILEGLPDYVPETAAGNIVGRGKLTFVDGSPLTEQIQTISFDTNDIAAYDPGKFFITTLDKITDVGSNDLSDAEHSAILGANKSYAQVIDDVTAGQISFKQANYGSIDEDASSLDRTKNIVLERVGGTTGAICVDFGFSGAGINSADYTFNSLTHTGANDDVFWLDGEGGDKTIQITAVDDQAYEELETLTITWQLKTNCDYDANPGDDPVAIPSVSSGGNLTTMLAINDQTNDIELKFGQSLYTTTEQGEPTLEVTVYATQSGSFADLGALSNKTPFSVYLNRESISADEIDHYGDLTSQQVVSFASDQTSKVISIPIVDNCDAADSLTFNMNLTNDDVSLPSTNPPAGLLKVGSASTQVSIDNYSAKPTVSIGYHYDGITDTSIKANWNGDIRVTSKISSGQRTPKATQMGVKANIGHACYKKLQYTWINFADTSPVRPVAIGLSNFSTMPVIAGYDKVDASGDGAIHSDLFNLPFIIKQNTKLAFELEIIDPEIGNVEYTANSANADTKIAGLAHEINMKQSYRRIENNGEGGNNCVASNSSGYGSCGNTTGGTQLAFNEATRQLVWYNTGGVKCLAAPNNGGVYTTDCGTSSEQKWKLVDGGNYDGVQRYGATNYHLTEYLLRPYFRLATGGTSGARRFTWDTFGVGSGG